MYGIKRIILILFLAMLLGGALSGSAAAKQLLYEGYIEAGDGYQINNFVIDVVEVFPSNDYASFYVYEEDDEILDKGLSINDSFTFEVEGEEVNVTLLNTVSGVLDKAKVAITIDDDDEIFTKGIVDGGHEDAEFAGTPELEITKSVSSETINVGDTITVTVTVENDGDDEATDIRFSDPLPEKFILEETFVSQTGKMDLDVGESQQIFVYRIKATAAGEYILKPTTATFSNSVGQDIPQASSNTVIVAVEGEAAEAPELEVSCTADPADVPRSEDIECTLNIRNTGEGSAEAVSLVIDLPEGLEYKNGDAEIEFIGEKPKIYFDSFGVQQEKELTFTVKALEMGTYTITGQYSYRYDAGTEDEELSGDFSTGVITVTEGKYDSLLEQPIYVYIVPAFIIIGIAAWVIHRRRQYRFR
jgi:uncharacterized repeat protein (TIGR01451 family)